MRKIITRRQTVSQGAARWRDRVPRRRTGHNLPLRLRTRKDGVVRFLVAPAVPFTNDTAEQSRRMMKNQAENLRSLPRRRRCPGLRDCALIRPFIAIAKKQGWNIIQVFSQHPDELINRIQTA